jgi:hypothetical protein
MAAALCLVACAADDTIVALNVSSTNVGSVASLHVVFQQGTHNHLVDLVPPTEQAEDGTPVIKPSFYERITLPGGWPSGDATVTVDALDGVTPTPIVTGIGIAEVESEETVAAYVDLELPGPDEGAAGADAQTAGAAGMSAVGGGGAGPGTGAAPGQTGGTGQTGGAAATGGATMATGGA